MEERTTKKIEEEEETVAAAAAAAACYSSSDDSAASYETVAEAAAETIKNSSSSSTSTSAPSTSSSSKPLPLSTEFAHDHLLKNAVPSFAHVPQSVDGIRGALAALERRVARGEEWDAAASGFARGVGAELEKLQLEVGECSRARLMGDARLEATERGVEMLHGYLRTAAAALGPEAVEEARRRGAALASAAAVLAGEKRRGKAMEAELRRVKEACRELQGRLDEVEKEKEVKETTTAREASPAAAAAAPPAFSRPRNKTSRRRSSFLGGLFGPSTAVSKLGKGERRRLSSSCAGEEKLALATMNAKVEEEEEEVKVVVEEAE
jgi:hypothetical protein